MESQSNVITLRHSPAWLRSGRPYTEEGVAMSRKFSASMIALGLAPNEGGVVVSMFESAMRLGRTAA